MASVPRGDLSPEPAGLCPHPMPRSTPYQGVPPSLQALTAKARMPQSSVPCGVLPLTAGHHAVRRVCLGHPEGLSTLRLSLATPE